MTEPLRTARALAASVVVAALLLTACEPAPGPIADDAVGLVYPVPDGSGAAGHINDVPVLLVDDELGPIGSAYVRAGSQRLIGALEGADADTVAFRWDPHTTALADRSQFWAMPAFIKLRHATVNVNGVSTPLAFSGLRYLRGEASAFDDPLTPGHDGIAISIRRAIACQTSSWKIGSQRFTVDILEQGLHQGDRTLIDKGVAGLDFGASLEVDAQGNHIITRSCDGVPLITTGGTHSGTNWWESLARGVYLLAASPYAGEYSTQIATYIERLELLATIYQEPTNYADWQSLWLVDSRGDIFTHKTYMRASALGLTASLTDDPVDAARWAADAAALAQLGMSQQRPDGVNPEKGGHDVVYQAFGTVFAENYYSTLAPDDPLRPLLAAKIDNALAWLSTRIDRQTGQVDITGSTRICLPNVEAPYEPSYTIYAFLEWSVTHPNRAQLADEAVLVDTGHKIYGNPCPQAAPGASVAPASARDLDPHRDEVSELYPD